MPEIVLDQYALTTLEAVKQAGSGIDDTDPELDNSIRFEINAVSRRVLQAYQVEFKMPLAQTTAFDGAMTAGSAILNSASGNFQAGDVGKTIVVYGAGVAGVTGKLETTILSRQSASQVTLAAPAVNTVSSAQYVYGSVTRSFDMTGDGYGNGSVDFWPGSSQAVTSVLIDTQGGAAGTTLTATAFDYQTDPLSEPLGVYSGLTVYSWGSQQYSTIVPWGVTRQVQITGLWGYPQVPPDVENAVIGQVIDNLNASYRQVSNTPIPGDFPEPGTVRRSGMNAQLRSTMDMYKRWTVVG